MVKSHPSEVEKKNERRVQNNMKTRLSQSISNENPYRNIRPVLPGQKPYPVQFEPLAHIRLSRSTYKVTTFIEFAPYIQSFNNFNQYLESFLKDLEDPKRVGTFKYLLTKHMGTYPGKINDKNDAYTWMTKLYDCKKPIEQTCGKMYQDGKPCRQYWNILCRARKQFRGIANATEYIREAFKQIRTEFLAVIDHLETEREEPNERVRREQNYQVETDMKLTYSKLTKETLNFWISY